MIEDVPNLTILQKAIAYVGLVALLIAAEFLGQTIGGVGSVVSVLIPLFAVVTAGAVFKRWRVARGNPQTNILADLKHLKQVPIWQRSLEVTAGGMLTAILTLATIHEIGSMLPILLPVFAGGWIIIAICTCLFRFATRR